jgi:LPXTG-site transpeptidase (sortase) family protein
MTEHWRKTKLSRVNSLLLILIVAVNGYLTAAPFAPQWRFWWQSKHSHTAGHLRHKIQPSAPAPAKNNHQSTPAKSQPNQLIIPAMQLDQKILEGPVSQTYAILKHGVWRWPEGSSPEKGGNTILVGHRFTYTDPRGVFYFMNKAHPGDHIGIIWHNKTYNYKIMNTKVVPPSDTSILKQTTQPTLTMYTCTPLWWPKNRLVVTATLQPPHPPLQEQAP